MRVLIVSKALVNRAYRQKLVELARLGVEVIAVVPPEWREGGTSQRLEPGGDGYELLVTTMRWNGHFHLHHYPELPDLIRRRRPDLVHVDEEPYNLATYLGVTAAFRAGIPALFFSWQNLYRRYPPPFSMLERAVYRRVDHALAGSPEVAGVLRRKGYRKCLSVVPQFGVDPDVFRPALLPGAGFTVGFLNRLIPGKAPLLALEAFSRLPDDCRLRVVGDGPLRERLEAEIKRLGLTKRVAVQRRLPSSQIPDVIRSCDVVVLPSITTPHWKEQFGRVLIEAMACGVPVVGSDSGEIPRVVGDAGLIVPEGDSETLSAALRRLHADADLRAVLGERGRRRVLDNFTHARVARLTLDAYSQTLAGL